MVVPTGSYLEGNDSEVSNDAGRSDGRPCAACWDSRGLEPAVGQRRATGGFLVGMNDRRTEGADVAARLSKDVERQDIVACMTARPCNPVPLHPLPSRRNVPDLLRTPLASSLFGPAAVQLRLIERDGRGRGLEEPRGPPKPLGTPSPQKQPQKI